MKNKIILSLFFVLFGKNIYSNDSLRFSHYINVSFSKPDYFKSKLSNNYRFLMTKENLFLLQIEYNHPIFDFLSIGVYGTIEKYSEYVYQLDSISQAIFPSTEYCWHYGFNTKLQVLPLIFKKNIPRFDTYLSGNIGLVSDFHSKNKIKSFQNEHFIEYSILGGLSLYVFKRIGIMGETGLIQNKYYSGRFSKLGLIFRF